MFKLNGFTIMEIMVSISLFALILLAFDAMQLTAWRANQKAYFLTAAAQQVKVMQERLTALQNDEGLAEQIVIWNHENQILLPNGKGTIIGNYPLYQIHLSWDPSGFLASSFAPPRRPAT